MFTDDTMEVEVIDSLSSHKMRCMSFGLWTGLYRPTMSEDFPAQEGFFFTGQEDIVQFFYTGQEDIVQCWFCKEEFCARQFDYDPSNEHWPFYLVHL